MAILIVLDPKAPSPPGPSSSALVVPLEPGLYSAKLLDWDDHKSHSAWNAWDGAFDPCKHQGWMNCFLVARWMGEGIDHGSKSVVGLPRSEKGVFASSREAFDAFPLDATFHVPLAEKGRPTPMLFWLVSDFYGELGELRIEIARLRGL